MAMFASMMLDKGSSSLYQMASNWETFGEMIEIMNNMVTQMVDDSEVALKSIQSRSLKVDAIVVTAQFGYTGFYLAHRLKCPMIWLSPVGPAPHWAHILGNPENPSYQPTQMTPFVAPFTFLQRLRNFLLYAFEELNVIADDYISFYFQSGATYNLMTRGNMTYEEINNIHHNPSKDGKVF